MIGNQNIIRNRLRKIYHKRFLQKSVIPQQRYGWCIRKNIPYGNKVLNSDNKDIKQRVLSGETSISASYKVLIIYECRNLSNDVV